MEKQGAVTAPVGGSKHKNGVGESGRPVSGRVPEKGNQLTSGSSHGPKTRRAAASMSNFARTFPPTPPLLARNNRVTSVQQNQSKVADNKLHQFACCWPHSCPSVGN